MAYSLSLLTTRALCDAVLAYVNDRLTVFTFREQESEFHTGNATDTATALSSELSGLVAYITALTPVVTALPAGKSRDMQTDELRRKTNRRDELASRQGKVGPERLVEREFEQALLPPQVTVAQDLIAQVTAHRATLTI